jgi:hypothetical protein
MLSSFNALKIKKIIKNKVLITELFVFGNTHNKERERDSRIRTTTFKKKSVYKSYVTE